MKPYSLNKKLMAIAIRLSAERQVGDCDDYKIMLCAAAVHQIEKMQPTLEELSAADLASLYEWIKQTEHVNVWA